MKSAAKMMDFETRRGFARSAHGNTAAIRETPLKVKKIIALVVKQLVSPVYSI